MLKGIRQVVPWIPSGLPTSLYPPAASESRSRNGCLLVAVGLVALLGMGFYLYFRAKG